MASRVLVPALLRIERIEGQARVLLEQPLGVGPAAPPVQEQACQAFSVIGGPPRGRCINLLLLSEGYTQAEEPKFRADAARYGEILLSAEPYQSRRREFHV